MTKYENFNTLLDVLTYWAKVQPERKAYTMLDSNGAEDSCITYGELYSQATEIARFLLANQLQFSNAVLIYPPGIEFIVAFWGCLYAGVSPAPIHTPKRKRSNKKIADLVLSAQAKAILVPSVQQKVFQDTLSKEENWPQDIAYVATDTITSASLTQNSPLPEIENSQTAFLQFTSGSTSLPKGVVVSHESCLRNLEMIRAMSQTTEESTFVSWLPHYHDLGLVAHLLYGLYSGGHCVILSPFTFASQPIRWLEAITKYRAEYTGAPNFAYRLCVEKIQPSERKNLDLSSLRVAINAAEPVDAQTLLDFSQAFADNGFESKMFLPAYGMAEATVFIASGLVENKPILKKLDWSILGKYDLAKEATGNAKEKVFVGCGNAWLDQEVHIVNPEENRLLPPNSIGEIWVTGSNLMSGYYQNQEATAKTLVDLEGDDRLYLRTGDLGFLDETGELYITGRIKNMIIVNGVNYYPQDIECCVEQAHPDIRSTGVAAFSVPSDTGEELVIFAELKRAGVSQMRQSGYLEKLAEDICLALGESFEIPLREIVFLKPMQLPKTSSGKVRRQQCKQEFLQNSIDALATWNQNQLINQEPNKVNVFNIEKTFKKITSMGSTHLTVFNNLIQMLMSQYGIKLVDFDIDKPIFLYGIDSPQLFEIHNRLQKQLGCQIPTKAVFQADNFKVMLNEIASSISNDK